jgi:hypothetical protein
MKKTAILAVLIVGFFLVHGHPLTLSTPKAPLATAVLVHGHPLYSIKTA